MVARDQGVGPCTSGFGVRRPPRGCLVEVVSAQGVEPRCPPYQGGVVTVGPCASENGALPQSRTEVACIPSRCSTVELEGRDGVPPRNRTEVDCLQGSCSATELGKRVERRGGVEPPYPAWKAGACAARPPTRVRDGALARNRIWVAALRVRCTATVRQGRGMVWSAGVEPA